MGHKTTVGNVSFWLGVSGTVWLLGTGKVWQVIDAPFLLLQSTCYLLLIEIEPLAWCRVIHVLVYNLLIFSSTLGKWLFTLKEFCPFCLSFTSFFTSVFFFPLLGFNFCLFLFCLISFPAAVFHVPLFCGHPSTFNCFIARGRGLFVLGFCLFVLS